MPVRRSERRNRVPTQPYAVRRPYNRQQQQNVNQQENEEQPRLVRKANMGLGRRNFILASGPEELSFLKMAFLSVIAVLSPYKVKPPLEPFQNCWRIMTYLWKVVENVSREQNPVDMPISENDLLIENCPFLNIMTDADAQSLYIPIDRDDHRLVTAVHSFIIKLNVKLTTAVITEILTEIKSGIGLIASNPIYSKVCTLNLNYFSNIIINLDF